MLCGLICDSSFQVPLRVASPDAPPTFHVDGSARGGSFGSDLSAARGTFRNWDYPIRRQIFSGFRCARDAAPGEG